MIPTVGTRWSVTVRVPVRSCGLGHRARSAGSLRAIPIHLRWLELWSRCGQQLLDAYPRLKVCVPEARIQEQMSCRAFGVPRLFRVL